MRLASKVSGTTSVAPASCSSLMRASSWVRTSTGTSGRRRRTLCRMPIEVAGSEKLMTIALAVRSPTLPSSSSSAESPNRTGSPAWRAARMRAGSRSSAMYSKPCDSSTRATFWPTRPKPHRMTCSRRAISVVAASSRSLAVCAGACSCSSQRATRLLLLRISGLSSIDSTIATSSGSPRPSGTSPACSRMVHSAIPNSPPMDMTIPVRSALKREVVKGRVTRAAMVALRITSVSSMSTAMASSLARPSRCTSSSMPTEMKNSPSSRSRNGRITASIWCRYSVSASIMPDRNAPRANDRPATCDTHAEASTTSSTASVNSSRRRL